jgi:hypothetical protein
MTSSGSAIAWRGHLADETDEALLSTSTTMGDRDLIYVDTPSREEMPSTKYDFRDTFIPCDSWMRLQEYSWTRRLGHRQLLYIAAVNYLLSIKFPPEEECPVADALTSPSSWPTRWQPSEPNPSIWRGIFSPPHQWKVLISEEIDIKTTTFRRLKPGAIIDRRTYSAPHEDRRPRNSGSGG